MSALASYNGTGLPSLKTEQSKKIINRIVWTLFDQIKDDSIKLSLWKIPVSIKIAKFSVIIELLVGERNGS